MIVEPGCAEHRVRVAVDEAGKQDPGDLHYRHIPLHVTRCTLHVLVRTDCGDALAFDQHGDVLQHLQVRQFATAAGTSGSATRHDLPGTDEEGLQSCAPPSPSRIGRRIPWRWAASIASG